MRSSNGRTLSLNARPWADTLDAVSDAAGNTAIMAQTRKAGYIPPATGNKLAGTVSGLSVKLTAYSITQTTSTTLTITGNNTGGTVTIPVTVSRDTSID